MEPTRTEIERMSLVVSIFTLDSNSNITSFICKKKKWLFVILYVVDEQHNHVNSVSSHLLILFFL